MNRSTLFIAACAAAISVPAAAAEIISANSAVINSGGPGFGSISNTHNQSGLSSGYVSGVTDFDTYVASNPKHTYVFSGFEWFSNNPSSSAEVTYDLGAIFGIDGVALWNEEASGIGLLDLFGSTDGSVFSALGSFSPVNSALDTNYGPQVFAFQATSARFVKFAMSRCPQSNSTFDSCAIGEVAFRTAAVTSAVPEPATWAMMLVGFGAIGHSLRRRRQHGIAATATA